MRRKSAVALCAAFVAALTAGGALAGEVIGPPGTPGVAGSGQPDLSTAAPLNSNSICSYNGLNDFQQGQGQLTFIVQTPHNQGVPGQPGADAAGSGTPGAPTCGGGSNFRNP
jgi:hypothetical protein